MDEETNRNLEAEITWDELKFVLSSFTRGKSLGPDGLSVKFYLGFFDLLEHDLLQVVEESRLSRQCWELSIPMLHDSDSAKTRLAYDS